MLICSGDRDALPAGRRPGHRALPAQGRVRAGPDGPGRGVAAIRRRPGALPRPGRAGRRDQRQPARRPGVGPKTAAKWINQYGGVEGVVARVDEIKGKAGDSLREHLADVIRNYELNRLVADLELPVRPADARWHGWDREAVHQVFDTLQFRILRDRLYQYLDAVEPEAEAGFDLAGEVLHRARCAAAGWPTHAPAGTASGLAVGRHVRPRHTASVTGLALATAAGAAAWFDPAGLDADRRGGARGVAGRRAPAQGAARQQAGVLAFAAHGWALAGIAGDTALAAYLARPDQRSYDLDRPGPALPAPRAAGRRPGERPAHPGRAGRATGWPSRTSCSRPGPTLDLADAIDAELSRDGEQSARLMAEVELPLMRVLAGMERTGIAADTDYLSELEAHFAAEVKAAAQGAYAVVGREFNLGSPKQLQEILFDRAGPAQDQEDQDRLHHRRRRPAVALRADRAPAAGAPAAPPRRGQAQVHGGRPAQVGLRRRADPHHLQPDGGGHRPALLHRAQPAEHPDPHRGGPADPARLRGGRGLRVPADRRLQPDRDADHGAPVRRTRR